MKTIVYSLMAALALISPASAVRTGNLTWTGDKGYVFEADFTFDSHRPEVHATYGLWYTGGGLIDFHYSVFGPDGELLQSGYDIQNRMQEYVWMEFHLDTITGTLLNGYDLDIGNDPEYWLSGGTLMFFGEMEDPESPGDYYEEATWDIDSGTISISLTGAYEPGGVIHKSPDGGSTALLLLLPLAGMVTRKFRVR